MNAKIFLSAISLIFILSIAQAQDQTLTSGLDIGKDCPAFDPKHISGPDKGTSACPMCKYGYQQGVMIWMNTDSWDNISRLSVALEKEIQDKGLKRIRVFLMYMNPEGKSTAEMGTMLTAFSKENNLKKVAVTYIPNPTDPKTAGAYDINPDKKIKNTVIVYKSRGVFDKTINFTADPSSIEKLIASVRDAEQRKSF
jgi:protocatechuate 3,4-dioxygenase beta subunit